MIRVLRKAGTETTRALGINVPTVFQAILFIVLAIVIRPSLARSTASNTEFDRWLGEFLPWLISLLTVFVLLLIWNIGKIARRERSVSAHLKMVADSEASMDDRMTSSLSHLLMDPSYGVIKCYAFGSVVRQDPTRDVDIVIQFASSKRGQVRTYRDRLRNIESSFQELYDRQLHIQTFLSSEDEPLQCFLNKTGAFELIMER